MRTKPKNTKGKEGEAEAGERPNVPACAGTSSNIDPAVDTTLEVTPVPSASATQQSFAVAGNQFNALARFGSERASAVLIEEVEQRHKAIEDAFIHERAAVIDAHGDLVNYRDYLQAVEAIQAKAAVLGYGVKAKTVPITSVPGGYVGRYEGNDIYAASK